MSWAVPALLPSEPGIALCLSIPRLLLRRSLICSEKILDQIGPDCQEPVFIELSEP